MNGENEADALKQDHEAAFADLGEAAALDAGPEPAPLESMPDMGLPAAPPPAELDVEVPDVAEPPAAPVADVRELTTDHDEAFKELGQIAKELTPAAKVVNKAKARRQQRHDRMGIPAPKKQPPLQAQHNQAFIELGNVVREEPGEHADAPVAIELPPEEGRKIGEAGGAAKEHMAAAVVAFADEDKEWRASLSKLFLDMAREVSQQRLELDKIRGLLERMRE